MLCADFHAGFCLLKQKVLLVETKYFKQMRKDNVTLLKIKWL